MIHRLVLSAGCIHIELRSILPVISTDFSILGLSQA